MTKLVTVRAWNVSDTKSETIIEFERSCHFENVAKNVGSK